MARIDCTLSTAGRTYCEHDTHLAIMWRSSLRARHTCPSWKDCDLGYCRCHRSQHPLRAQGLRTIDTNIHDEWILRRVDGEGQDRKSPAMAVQQVVILISGKLVGQRTICLDRCFERAIARRNGLDTALTKGESRSASSYPITPQLYNGKDTQAHVLSCL